MELIQKYIFNQIYITKYNIQLMASPLFIKGPQIGDCIIADDGCIQVYTGDSFEKLYYDKPMPTDNINPFFRIYDKTKRG